RGRREAGGAVRRRPAGLAAVVDADPRAGRQRQAYRHRRAAEPDRHGLPGARPPGGSADRAAGSGGAGDAEHHHQRGLTPAWELPGAGSAAIGAALRPIATDCRHKKPRQLAGFFAARKEGLAFDANFFSLHAFLAAGSDESNSLAFFQGFEAVSLDGLEVYEQVVTRLRGDEAVALLIVEPLDGTGLAVGHGLSPWTKLVAAQETPWPGLS